MGVIQKAQGKKAMALCLLFICLFMSYLSASAASASFSVTLTVEQEFTDSASASPSDIFTYQLTANETGNPMPSGSSGGEYTFTIDGSGSVSVGPIIYDHAGVYTYELGQVITLEDTGYTYDMQTYTVKVYIKNGSGGLEQEVIIVQNADGEKVSGIRFETGYAPLVIDKFVGVSGTTDYYKVGMNMPVETGERFDWYIRSTIPTNIGTASAESLKITDALDGHFDYQAGSVNIYIMPDSRSDLSACTILSASDYTVNFNAATNTLTAELTASGIATVKSLVASGNQYSVLAYSCVVNDTAPQGVALYSGATMEYARDAAASSISYRGTRTPAVTLLSTGSSSGVKVTPLANSSSSVTTVSVAEEPEVHTGEIEVTKLVDGTKELLPGAVFGIAASEADAKAGNFIATGTTDQNGKLIFSGLKYGLLGDKPNENSNNTTFWLVETKAPDGYKLMEAPVEITFSYQQDQVTGSYYFAKLNVYNVKTGAAGKTGTQPKTGDNSNVSLYAGIAALSLTTLIILLVTWRKKKDTAAETKA